MSAAEGSFQQAPSVLVRTSGPEVLIASPARVDVLRLSETAAAVWRVLDEPRTIGEIVEEMAGRYETAASRISDEVARVVHELMELGVLHRMEP